MTRVHNLGHVILDDHMGSDLAIVNNARVSFNDEADVMDERNAGLIPRMKWTTNLRAVMHFLSLRNSEHAQREIRDYAVAVEALAFEVAPVAMRAFVDGGRVTP